MPTDRAKFGIPREGQVKNFWKIRLQVTREAIKIAVSII